MIRLSLEGRYLAKGYSDLEIDLATVVYELGGNHCLTALQRSPFAFPSRNALFERRSEYKLKITVGKPRLLDLLDNVEIMVKETRPGHKLCGITLSMDEVASDGHLCYLTATDEIAGLCEHAMDELASVKMRQNLQVARAVKQALRDGKIHKFLSQHLLGMTTQIMVHGQSC